MWKSQRGMSLVEIIIVIAIAGILTGASVMMFGHIRYANTQKVVETVDTALSQLRASTMSREGRQYLYIYRLSDGCYMKLLADGTVTEVGQSGVLDEDGTKLCGRGTEILRGDGTAVEGDEFIRVVYTKSGLFGTGAGSVPGINTDSIVIRGSGTYTIHLVSETGRHYID